MDSKLDITANGCPFSYLRCQGRETVWPRTYRGCVLSSDSLNANTAENSFWFASWATDSIFFVFDSPSGALRPPMSGGIEGENRYRELSWCYRCSLLKTNHDQCKCWQGEVADTLWQCEACLKDSAPTSKERGWRGSSQWDRYNSKEMRLVYCFQKPTSLQVHALPGIRECLACCDGYIRIVRNPKANQDQATISGNVSVFNTDSTLL